MLSFSFVLGLATLLEGAGKLSKISSVINQIIFFYGGFRVLKLETKGCELCINVQNLFSFIKVISVT